MEFHDLLHAMGAATRWPELRVQIFEMPTVCEVAQEVIGNLEITDADRFASLQAVQPGRGPAATLETLIATPSRADGS